MVLPTPQLGQHHFAYYGGRIGTDYIQHLLAGALQEYRQEHTLEKHVRIYRLLKNAIKKLPNLKRLKFRDGRSGGILINSNFQSRSLQALKELIPLSEALFFTRCGTGHYQQPWAFLHIISAFHDLDRNIEELSVENSGTLQMGLPMISVENVPSYLRFLAVSSFTRILHLSLSISTRGCKRGWFMGSRWTDIEADDEFFREAPAGATQLRSLGLHFDWIERRMHNLVLTVSQEYPQLQSLSFSNMYIPESLPFVDFLQHKLPVLRHLSLRSCEIVGHWEQIFQSLSDHPSFTLDSFDSLELFDNDYICDQRSDTNLPPLNEDTTEGTLLYLSKISNEAILFFFFIINLGTSNPFKSRKWRLFDRHAYEMADTGVSAPYMQGVEFEDVSDYEPPEEDPYEDPDGPEYDSEYDFSAESESEDEDEDEEIV
jgi:hypothetical protein